MPEGLEAKLTAILETLRADVGGIRGSMVASLDGLPIAHDFVDADDDIDLISAMSAAIQGAVTRAVSRLHLSSMETTMILTKDAAAAICNIADNASLLVLFDQDVNIVSALEEMKTAGHEIALLLGFEE